MAISPERTSIGFSGRGLSASWKGAVSIQAGNFNSESLPAGLYCELSHYEPWTRLRIKIRKTGLRSRFKVVRSKTFRAGIVSETRPLDRISSAGAPRPKARRASRLALLGEAHLVRRLGRDRDES